MDAADRVGHSWRSQWDALQLFTPAQYTNLPALPFPALVGTCPETDDVAGYLKLYMKHCQLPIVSGVGVTWPTNITALPRHEQRQ